MVGEAGYGTWSDWSPCNSTCDSAYQSRDRTCEDKDLGCSAQSDQSKPCPVPPCPGQCFMALYQTFSTSNPPPPLREKSPMQVYSESTGLIILHFSGRRIYGMGQLECLFQNLWTGPTVTCKGVHQPCASSWRSRM